MHPSRIWNEIKLFGGKVTTASDIKEAIIDIVEASLPLYTKIPDPYNIDTNSFLNLYKGYGVAVGPGFNTERYVGCLVTWARTYNIIIVQQITTTQNEIDIRESIDSEFLDDNDLLWKAFYLNSGLDGLAIKSTVLADGGIIPLDIGGLKFLSMELTLEVEYQDDPNN